MTAKAIGKLIKITVKGSIFKHPYSTTLLNQTIANSSMIVIAIIKKINHHFVVTPNAIAGWLLLMFAALIPATDNT